MTKKTLTTLWEIRTYDVWGNKQDGYEVNDSYVVNRSLRLDLKIKTYNDGTPQQFQACSISDYKLKQIFGVSCKLDVYGDDLHYYVNRESDNYPLGELNCISHDSLSSIDNLLICLHCELDNNDMPKMDNCPICGGV